MKVPTPFLTKSVHDFGHVLIGIGEIRVRLHSAGELMTRLFRGREAPPEAEDLVTKCLEMSLELGAIVQKIRAGLDSDIEATIAKPLDMRGQKIFERAFALDQRLTKFVNDHRPNPRAGAS